MQTSSIKSIDKPNPKREYWPTTEWKYANPKDIGPNETILNKIENALQSKHKQINGIVIVKNGYIVFEKYREFSPSDKHNIASVTKSVLSALIGIAIDNEFIKSVDQKVMDFFPEYKTLFNDLKKRTISVKQLLNMTAPIASKSTGNNWEPLDRLRRQPDWVKYIIGLLGKGKTGQFQYSTAATHLLSAILTKATGLSAREFANQRLFEPLGMQTIPKSTIKTYDLENVFGKKLGGWLHDPQGNSAGGWGLTLSLYDMCRFGFLFVNKGIWENKQIISEKWINESTKENENNYGYLWWLNRINNVLVYAAIGSGGNMICCIPEKDLVVSIAANVASKQGNPWFLFENYNLMDL